MKVYELVKQLQKCNQDAEVRFEYDYDGDDIEEEVNYVTQTTTFGIGDEGDDVVSVILSH